MRSTTAATASDSSAGGSPESAS
ncbi:MAG: hypothetical protein QOE06_2572, partial [Thermoleophilaceae bacterium]|nr:hypothetical protein [Thermoleophilaceae bacterium]